MHVSSLKSKQTKGMSDALKEGSKAKPKRKFAEMHTYEVQIRCSAGASSRKLLRASLLCLLYLKQLGCLPLADWGLVVVQG